MIRTFQENVKKICEDFTTTDDITPPDIDIISNGINGLINNTNSCYMNSVLQSLLHSYDLVLYLTNKKTHQFIDKQSKSSLLIIAFMRLINSYWSNSNRLIDPLPFKKILGLINQTFLNHQQQDAHETLNFILDQFHEGFKTEYAGIKKSEHDAILENIDRLSHSEIMKFIYSRYDFSIINQIFAINELQQLTCRSCGYKSNQLSHSSSLILEINDSKSMKKYMSIKHPLYSHSQSQTIYRCMNSYFQSDKIDEWKCPKCSHLGCDKSLSILNSPSCLIITIKRFEMSMNGRLLKNNIEIDFPEFLNIAQYLHHQSDSDSDSVISQYRLSNVICHVGSIHGGHYYSYSRHIDKNWYNLNDSHFSKVSSHNVLDNQKEAYILFYSKTFSPTLSE
jgi:ubiquitin carboxyl-terminal hydrolase 36/42